jgi:hypothetical protein
MKTQMLGLFLIILGICLVFIHKNMQCPPPKVDYRYIPRQLTDDATNYGLISDFKLKNK